MRRILFLALLFCLTLPSLAQDNTQTPYEIALERIEEAELIHASRLSFSGLGLTEIPPKTWYLQLTELNLENNNLTSLPPQLANLTYLERLILNGNDLSSLPPEIARLSKLEGLFLHENQLNSLPPEIGTLLHLQVLTLNNNLLDSLPSEIGNLRNLERLNLANNQFTSLPPEIGTLGNLQRLDLSTNQLSSLPPEIGNLANLQYLNVRNNQLNGLPPELGQLHTLCYLSLSNNKIQSLPKELNPLLESLKNPECSDYPYNLHIEGNPFISLPEEVIAQGTPAILDYLGNEAWWHLQRLIVGGASSFGLVAAVILGIRWRQRGKQKKKR
jgi:internalin A